MRQRVVSVLSGRGTFLCVSGLSAAARKAGFEVSDVVGSKVWDYNTAEQGAVIREQFAKVMQDGEPVEYAVTSEIAGTTERWNVRLARFDGPGEVLCIGTQVQQEPPPSVTEEQRTILRLLADDLTMEQVAKAMTLTRSAASHRIAVLRKKFGVSTLHGLVAAAGRHGLLMDS